jgi:hypothetical protein
MGSFVRRRAGYVALLAARCCVVGLTLLLCGSDSLEAHIWRLAVLMP